MSNHITSSNANSASNCNDPRTAPGVIMIDIGRVTDDRFAIAANDLVAWIATMNIAKRVVVAPFDWSDSVCVAWRRHGFDILRVSADNDNVATAAREIASRYARVYVATSPEDLTGWSDALPDTPIFVGCVRSSADIIPAPVKARAAAIHYVQRFMFPLAPALGRAA